MNHLEPRFCVCRDPFDAKIILAGLMSLYPGYEDMTHLSLEETMDLLMQIYNENQET